MASYKRFEEIPVWNLAIDLATAVFELTSHLAFKFRGDLVNQIRRSALSVSNNIAEGYERENPILSNETVTVSGASRDVNKIVSVKVTDGCDGNLQGISRLLQGMEVDDLNALWYDPQGTWDAVHAQAKELDELINAFNEESGVFDML